jgi:hypothetical protein
MIYYSRFCCMIRISGALPVDDEILAREDAHPDDVRARFRDAHDRGEWYRETPALAAHLMALRIRHHSAETSNPGERLVPTASAMAYTGRQRQTLYRWSSEGRITRYGTPGEALWDVLELPPARPDGTSAPPPPRK